MGCESIAVLPLAVNSLVSIYPFMSCPRKQHNVPGQGLNPELSLRSHLDKITLHKMPHPWRLRGWLIGSGKDRSVFNFFHINCVLIQQTLGLQGRQNQGNVHDITNVKHVGIHVTLAILLIEQNNIYGLWTKGEVKMARYWLSSFFACSCTMVVYTTQAE